MIRKVANIALIVILLASTTGLTLYEHFCGGKLSSVSIYSVPDSCCGTDCNCCHNESVTIKIQDVFSRASFNYDFQLQDITLSMLQLYLEEQTKCIPQIIAFVNDLPPPISGRAILTSICVFRN